MATVKEVSAFLDSIAPCSMKMDFDNVGFLVGDGGKQVHKLRETIAVTVLLCGAATLLLGMITQMQSRHIQTDDSCDHQHHPR